MILLWWSYWRAICLFQSHLFAIATPNAVTPKSQRSRIILCSVRRQHWKRNRRRMGGRRWTSAKKQQHHHAMPTPSFTAVFPSIPGRKYLFPSQPGCPAGNRRARGFLCRLPSNQRTQIADDTLRWRFSRFRLHPLPSLPPGTLRLKAGLIAMAAFLRSEGQVSMPARLRHCQC